MRIWAKMSRNLIDKRPKKCYYSCIMNLGSPRGESLGKRVEGNRTLLEFRRTAELQGNFSQALRDLQRAYNSGSLDVLSENQIAELEAHLAGTVNTGEAAHAQAMDGILADLADLRSQKREERLAREREARTKETQPARQEVDPALARDSNTFDRMEREFYALLERSKSNDLAASKKLAANINGWLEELDFLSDRVQGKDRLKKEMEDARRMINQRGNIEHFFT